VKTTVWSVGKVVRAIEAKEAAKTSCNVATNLLPKIDPRFQSNLSHSYPMNPSTTKTQSERIGTLDKTRIITNLDNPSLARKTASPSRSLKNLNLGSNLKKKSKRRSKSINRYLSITSMDIKKNTEKYLS
jgi:hypothetical protein